MPKKKPSKGSKPQGKDANVQFCDLPAVPDRALPEGLGPNQLALIRNLEKKWVNETVLRYHFLNKPASWKGSPKQKEAVRDAFKEWKDLGIGLEFNEVSDPEDAEIRITFQRGGSWSYVGRDSIDLVADPHSRTMNFGWDLTTTYGHDTALHEIGHALGFPHEHQNPNAGIVWDEEKVYDAFAVPPNSWGRQKTFYNIIRKIDSAEVEGSDWDRDSVMHYQFSSGLIMKPEEYQARPLIPLPGLSETDIDRVKAFYPLPDKKAPPELKPFESRPVNIEPGEQLNFSIRPQQSRIYTIHTFGAFDSVIVLFDDTDGNPTYVSGDDDSGEDYNARLEVRLERGRTYVLRLRLYFSHVAGQGALMMW